MSAIKHFLTINVSPIIIYGALTSTEGVANWWTSETKVGNKIGETNSFNFGDKYYNEMKIPNLNANERVEWDCYMGDKEWIGTKLILEINGRDQKSTLRFMHDHWRKETDFFASCNYSWGYYLRSLKQYCETGEGTPFKSD